MIEVTRLGKENFVEIAALTDAVRIASVQATGHLTLQEISQARVSELFLSINKR